MNEVGNIGSVMISVIKDLPEELAIGGYELVWIISLIGLTIVLLVKKTKLFDLSSKIHNSHI